MLAFDDARRHALRALSLAALGGLAACAGPRQVVAPASPPPVSSAVPAASPAESASGSVGAPVPSPPAAVGPPPRPRLALALGGGAARGFAHVGVYAALESAGILPDLIVGTSAGSVVGALIASGMRTAELRNTALSLEEGLLGDWSFGGKGLLKGQALEDLVNRLVGRRTIERFPLPFAATVTDLYNGQLMLIRRGNAGRAVRASSAVPGLFQPVQIDGREYVDGGVVSPVPVRAARGLGADLVIAVDISAKPSFQETDTMGRILMQTFAIMGARIAQMELKEADFVVSPQIGDLGSTDFANRGLAINEGERAMRRLLPAIKNRLAMVQS
jgi:NTE family protein